MQDLEVPAGVTARPLSEALGVELVGLDLSVEQPQAVVEFAREAFNRYRLVLVRTDGVSAQEQERFVRWFGTPSTRLPLAHSAELPDPMMYVSNDRESDRGGEFDVGGGPLLLHSDYIFEEEPLRAICLFGEDVEGTSGQTIFVNGVRAAEQLDPGLRDKLSGLSARQIYHPSVVDQGAHRWTEGPDWYVTVRPVLETHPVTKDKVLWVSELMTGSIDGIDPDESEALLQSLFQYLRQDRFRYEHHWSPGDLIIWDNVALLHGRTPIAAGVKRNLRRYQVA
jgi:taurine dioxygenase